ncbi:MAG: hypothetical protein Q8Q39_02060 [bacterium]|nr:hypothetical protein [bacterium]
MSKEGKWEKIGGLEDLGKLRGSLESPPDKPDVPVSEHSETAKPVEVEKASPDESAPSSIDKSEPLAEHEPSESLPIMSDGGGELNAQEDDAASWEAKLVAAHKKARELISDAEDALMWNDLEAYEKIYAAISLLPIENEIEDLPDDFPGKQALSDLKDSEGLEITKRMENLQDAAKALRNWKNIPKHPIIERTPLEHGEDISPQVDERIEAVEAVQKDAAKVVSTVDKIEKGKELTGAEVAVLKETVKEADAIAQWEDEGGALGVAQEEAAKAEKEFKKTEKETPEENSGLREKIKNWFRAKRVGSKTFYENLKKEGGVPGALKKGMLGTFFKGLFSLIFLGASALFFTLAEKADKRKN